MPAEEDREIPERDRDLRDDYEFCLDAESPFAPSPTDDESPEQ